MSTFLLKSKRETVERHWEWCSGYGMLRSSTSFFFFFFFFLGTTYPSLVFHRVCWSVRSTAPALPRPTPDSHLPCLEVPRLGFESELQLPVSATATPDPSHSSLWQRQILNPLSGARDWTLVLTDTETQRELLFIYFLFINHLIKIYYGLDTAAQACEDQEEPMPVH